MLVVLVRVPQRANVLENPDYVLPRILSCAADTAHWSTPTSSPGLNPRKNFHT